MISFNAVSVLVKWPGFKFGFKVYFSIGIFPSTDDVLFHTGFRGVSMSTRPVSESSCSERGVQRRFQTWFQSTISDLVSNYGYRVELSSEGLSPGFKVGFQTRFQP